MSSCFLRCVFSNSPFTFSFAKVFSFMVFLWYYYWVSVEFLWDVHDVSMIFLKDFYGISEGMLWEICISMTFL